MYNIYIKTPLVNNSIHIPHLVEHSLFWKVKTSKDFFNLEEKSMSTHSFYTLLKLYENWEDKLEVFLKKIKEELNKENILFEKKIISKENNDISYNQLLIEKIWKKLYWEWFNYNKSNNVKYEDVIKYHKDFYIDENIFVIEKNKNFKGLDLKKEKVRFKEKFEIKLRWEKEIVFVFENDLFNSFLVTLLNNLFDNYLSFKLYHQKWEYYYWESDFWFFNDFWYISIWENEVWYLKWIDEEFIKNYIDFKLEKIINSNENLFIDFDWISLVKYWYALSDKSKKEIVDYLDDYLKIFLSKF